MNVLQNIISDRYLCHIIQIQQFQGLTSEAALICLKDDREVGIVKRVSLESKNNCQTMSYGPALNRCCAEGFGKELHELCSKINCAIVCISGWQVEMGLYGWSACCVWVSPAGRFLSRQCAEG